jgi:hypothetical protein
MKSRSSTSPPGFDFTGFTLKAKPQAHESHPALPDLEREKQENLQCVSFFKKLWRGL